MASSRSLPAPFLTKTYQLVEDLCTDDVISWNDKGTTFVVWKSAEFARDLLPLYFKHNNFSSFVRQLNTYGFRKIVPDRWEFQNEFFKRGEKDLLCEIHRRKTTHASTVQITPAGKSNGVHSSLSNSGDEVGSGSTDTKNNVSDETTTTQLSNLSGENEKLRKDNQLLSSELARTKKQCEDLMAFLSNHVNVAPHLINQADGFRRPMVHDDDNDDDDKEEECLKLFGVVLKGEKKRGRDEKIGGMPSVKAIKVIDYTASWMKMISSSGETSKVCN